MYRHIEYGLVAKKVPEVYILNRLSHSADIMACYVHTRASAYVNYTFSKSCSGNASLSHRKCDHLSITSADEIISRNYADQKHHTLF